MWVSTHGPSTIQEWPGLCIRAMIQEWPGLCIQRYKSGLDCVSYDTRVACTVYSTIQECPGLCMPWTVYPMIQAGSAQNPRNPRMFSNLTFLFKYPRLFSNLTQCSRMFLKRNVLKMPLFGRILALLVA